MSEYDYRQRNWLDDLMEWLLGEPAEDDLSEESTA